MSDEIQFNRKQWIDTEASGTAVTASDLNRIEQAVSDVCATVNYLTGFESELVTGSLDSHYVQVYRIGYMRCVKVFWNSHSGWWDDEVVTTLPEKDRPVATVFTVAAMNDSNGNNNGMTSIRIDADGSLTVDNMGGSHTSNEAISCHVVYFVQ